ncbi:MAG: hypothetical protein HY966_04175, partial [Ignavibacteriales bacterium]|nr:hypothetical protein [Ignavibacteriales bacterium]
MRYFSTMFLVCIVANILPLAAQSQDSLRTAGADSSLPVGQTGFAGQMDTTAIADTAKVRFIPGMGTLLTPPDTTA